MANEVRIIITAVDQFSKTMAAVGSKMKALGTSLTIGITAPITAIGVASIIASEKFNQGMANVASLIPGNTIRVAELSDGVKALSVQMGKTTQDLTDGLYQVISAFGDTGDSLDKLNLVTKAGVAGLSSTTDALNLVSAVTKGYGDTSIETSKKVADLAFQTVKLGQTTFPELAGSIGMVVPIAAKLGVTVEELFAGFATLTGVTGNASIVATQLSSIMRGALKPTEDMKKAVKTLGFESGSAVFAQLGLVEGMKALIGTTDGSEVAIGKLFQRVEGLTALFALTGGQADVFKTKMEAMTHSAGALDDAFNEQTNGVNKAGFAWKVLKAQFELIRIEMGEALEPAFNDLITILKTAIKSVASLIDWFKGLSKNTRETIAVVAGLAAAFGPVLIVVGTMVTLIASLVGPLALAVTAIAGLTTAGVLLATVWADSMDKVKKVFNNFFDSPDLFLSFLSAAGDAFVVLLTGFTLTMTEVAKIILKASSLIWAPLEAAFFFVLSKITAAFLNLPLDIAIASTKAAIKVKEIFNKILPKSFQLDTSSLEDSLKRLEKETRVTAKTGKQAWIEMGDAIQKSFSTIGGNISNIKDIMLQTGSDLVVIGKKIGQDVGAVIGTGLSQTFGIALDQGTKDLATQKFFDDLLFSAKAVGTEAGKVLTDNTKKSIADNKDKVTAELLNLFGNAKFLTADFGRVWANQLDENVKKLREAGVNEIDIEKFIASERQKVVVGTNQAIIENSTSTSEILGALWSNYLISVGNTARQTATIMFNAIQTFTQSTGDAIASVIVDGADLGDALANVFRKTVASMISGLVQLGIQLIITDLLGKALVTTQAAQKMAVQSSLAYAATFASVLASIPYPANIIAAPLAAGAEVAIMLGGAIGAGAAGAGAGAAIAGIADAGLTNVPQASTFMLSRGERVIAPAQNRDLTQFLATQKKANEQGAASPTQGGGVIIKQLNILPDAQIDEALMNKPISWWVRQVRKNILPALNELGNANATTTLRFKATR